MGRESLIQQPVKCPTGIKIRRWPSGRTTLMIQFNYRGVVCRETIKLEATSSNIQFAVRKRGEIINKIERGIFNYADYFPESKRALQFGQVITRKLIKELLDEYLEESKKRHEKSTQSRLIKVCNAHLYPAFGDIAIQDLKPMAIRTWLKTLTAKKKTIQNILMPFRAICKRAITDEYIKDNPFSSIILSDLVSKEASKSDFVVDPFDEQEIQAILTHAEGQIKNLYQFAFFTGLRPSELIGLRWGDIDWIHGSIYIKETIVDAEKKGPKTEAGNREIFLLPPALEALQNQKMHTFMDNHRVFQHPRTKKAWKGSKELYYQAWMPVMRIAKVRYRNPYQTRHTYASMMLSNGENPMWVSQQMGHKTLEVTLKRYARWIKRSGDRGYQTKHDWGQYTQVSQAGVALTGS